MSPSTPSYSLGEMAASMAASIAVVAMMATPVVALAEVAMAEAP